MSDAFVSDTLVFQYQQKMLDECPKCDACGKSKYVIVFEHVSANHRRIASAPVYALCEGPNTCEYHCTCHLDIPRKLGVTQVLHVM